MRKRHCTNQQKTSFGIPSGSVRDSLDHRSTFDRSSLHLRSTFVRTSLEHRSDIVREARSNEGGSMVVWLAAFL